MKLVVAALIVLGAAPAAAQQHQHHGHSPYAGLEARAIKALTTHATARICVAHPAPV